jgi:hypothetical protein
MGDTMRIGELFVVHSLDRSRFAQHMGWGRVTLHHKLAGKRGWTIDEVATAATWLRAHGVPVGDRDVAALVKAAKPAEEVETSHE